jgi:hypothetical protein
MWCNYLYDKGISPVPEPFKKLVHQGMILGENNIKMGKRYPEYVVNPSDIVVSHGADALRLYEMFMGPLEADKPWSNAGIDASKKFLDRIYRLFEENKVLDKENKNLEKIEKSFLTLNEIVQDRGCVYFNNETTDPNYYRNIDISYFNKYMLPEQKISILYSDNTKEEITELDATMLRLTNKLNLRGFVCECNKYGNFVLDTDGSLYTCVSNSPISSIYNYHIDIFKYNKCICLNNSCHPYLLEYGIKERIK